MKTLVLLILLVLNSCSACKNTSRPSDKVICDSYSQPIFDRFVDIAEKHNLVVDYSQIHSISFVPLSWGIQGLYSTKTKVIILNIDYQLPKVIADQLTPLQHQLMLQEGILYILAHEIGHSQGMEHLPSGTPGLMAEGDSLAYWLIVEKGIEDIICEAFSH